MTDPAVTYSPDTPLTWGDELSVKIDFMDETHQAFIELVNSLIATSGKQQFIEQYEVLIEHTKQHFQREEEKMLETGFPATGEHQADHRRVLNELAGFQRSLQRGRVQLVRMFVKERLPEWFRLHLATMDTALAVHIKTAGQFDE